MKKLLSALLASALMFSSLVAFAEDDAITVKVDGMAIHFDDQQPIIQNDRTLVPIRGVFNAMGCSVDWKDETQTVIVYTEDYQNRVDVTVDSNKMTKYLFTSVMSAEKSEIELDVPAVEMNDRVLVPLRAISEAFGSTVDWDDETCTVSINQNIVVDEEKEVELPTIYAKADKDTYEVGDTVTVTVYGKNMYPNNEALKMTSITLTAEYTNDVCEYDSTVYLPGADDEYKGMHVENPEYIGSMLKAVSIINDYPVANNDEIKLVEFTFTAKEAGKASVSLSDIYHTRLGEANLISFSDDQLKTNVKYSKKGTLVVDKTPCEITVK